MADALRSTAAGDEAAGNARDSLVLSRYADVLAALREPSLRPVAPASAPVPTEAARFPRMPIRGPTQSPPLGAAPVPCRRPSRSYFVMPIVFTRSLARCRATPALRAMVFAVRTVDAAPRSTWRWARDRIRASDRRWSGLPATAELAGEVVWRSGSMLFSPVALPVILRQPGS